MLSIKLKLERISINEQNNECKVIVKHIKNYLFKYCNHKIIDDLIDIDPDRSQIIHYCEYCETCFPYTCN